jgi:branched-chain amino acid transport system permease protein
MMDVFVQAAIISVALGAQYALLALGFTLIFSILGVVNFAHGGFYMAGGYIAYAAVNNGGFPYPLAVLIAVLGTGLIGYVFEILLVERCIDDHLSTMILTLGLYLVMTNAALIVFGPQTPQFNFPLTGSLRAGGVYITTANLAVLAICFATIFALYGVMYSTGLGRALRALADDRPVAAAMGIRPRLLFPLAFALATALAGLTGAIVTPILSLSPSAGDPVLVSSFIVVILGGLGSIWGATIAAFIVGAVESYSSIYLGGSVGALILFLAVLVLLVFRPLGLFGRDIRSA